MFPIVHYYVNQQIFHQPSPLLALGGLWPDLAGSCAPEGQRRQVRDKAHMMGEEFFSWCREYAPQALDLARGVASHGIQPQCVDYYADEYWPGYLKGRCFQLGEEYQDLVGEATGLAANFRWWKAHNFIEMGYELLVEERQPQLKYGLLSALEDRRAVDEAARVLSAYSQLPAESVRAVYANVPGTFAIARVTPEELCLKQVRALSHRFKECRPDLPAMISLLERIRAGLSLLEDDFPAYLSFATAAALSALEQA